MYLHAHTGDVVKFQNKHKFIANDARLALSKFVKIQD